MRTSPTRMELPFAASAVADAGQRALRLLDPDCTVPTCGCPYTTDLRTNLSPATRLLAVSSRDDRVVGARATHVTGGENIVVSGTHSGLVYNRAVYPHIGRFLSQGRVADPPRS
jgi:hypothetical protein